MKHVIPTLREGVMPSCLLALSLLLVMNSPPADAAGKDNGAKERRQVPTQPLQSRQDVERRDRERRDRGAPAIADLEIRTIDGSHNNTEQPDWGRADSAFIRLTYSDYSDGTGSPSGDRRPSPRAISNAVAAQPALITNSAGASDFIWLWGQFLDHDLDLTPVINPVEPFDIPVPAGDPFFDPENTGTAIIPLNRSLYTTNDGIREQMNLITAWIDASNVYGSAPATAELLRTLDGSGRLKTSDGDLLPFNPANPANFIAGDSRSNEHVALTAIHTLFVREHNYQADRVRRANPGLSDEQIYQHARMIVAAQMQRITYSEFLPVLLGRDALSPYRGYQPAVNPAIANEFATASYRFGHSMVSPQLLKLDRNNQPTAGGPIALRAAFFNPGEISANGIDPLLRGLARQVAQEIDIHIIDDLRNFLFGSPGAGGFDLASLNIQRGRDHGLPSYNEVRRRLGLTAAAGFADVSSDPDVQTRLASIYDTVEDIDLWVGGLAEDHVPGALVGETVRTILIDQFERLRDGDRFWYENHLPRGLRAEIERDTLAAIIRRNTGIGREIQDNVFIVAVSGRGDSDGRGGKSQQKPRGR